LRFPLFPLFMEDCFSLSVTREAAFVCELCHIVPKGRTPGTKRQGEEGSEPSKTPKAAGGLEKLENDQHPPGATAPRIFFPHHFGALRDQLVALAARHAAPTAYFLRDMAVADGLMSYGTSVADACRLTGVYVGHG
jgi:hypothetical protein